MNAESVEDLMSPRKGSLNTDIALCGALPDGGTGNGELDKLLSDGGSLVTSLENSVSGSHKVTTADSPEKYLDSRLVARNLQYR